MIKVTEYKGWTVSVSDDGTAWFGRSEHVGAETQGMDDTVEAKSLAALRVMIDVARKRASDFRPYEAWLIDDHGRGFSAIKVKVTSVIEADARYHYKTGYLRVSWKEEGGNGRREDVNPRNIFPIGWEPNDEVIPKIIELINEGNRIREEIGLLREKLTPVEVPTDGD